MRIDPATIRPGQVICTKAQLWLMGDDEVLALCDALVKAGVRFHVTRACCSKTGGDWIAE